MGSYVLGAGNDPPPFSYSQQEAREKEAESRTRAKREAEKVAVLKGSHHSGRMMFAIVPLKLTRGTTEGLCETTQKFIESRG